MTEICQRPGCGGPMIDGVCEDCGKPAVGKSVLSPGQPAYIPTNSVRSATVGTSATAGTGTSARTGSRRQTSRSTKGSSKRRQSLGGGLISLPPQPSLDPLKLVMAKAEVPLRKRVCPSCEAKVSRTKGFCTQCGNQYNYEPALKSGDLVNQKFEIKGPIAFGGLGWIYLGWDTVLSRWVVLKGLLNAKDEASAAAAVAERQFLAAVKHPKIVGIYDFVQHGEEGYIVMEYVGGRMVESLRKDLDLVNVHDEQDKVIVQNLPRHALSADDAEKTVKVAKRGVLPVEEAIAYILGILPAFSYLHANQFVYCDFKAENFMVEDDDVKLIDMGGVRRIGDPNGDIFGTRGYMAPEANDDPVEVSDLFTIGRTLAILIMDFDYQRKYETSLPAPNEYPVLTQHEALYRFLLRSTHTDPDQRFQSADEMMDQLHGVLREIVALRDTPKPAESRVFTGDNLLDADDVEGTQNASPRLLPDLKVNPDDPAANEILRTGGITDPEKRVAAFRQIVGKMPHSVEARLRLADAHIALSQYQEAYRILRQVLDEDAFDWRAHWYLGKGHLAEGKPVEARADFGKVYFEMPGEIAPKLAIAAAAELAGQLPEAVAFYSRVARVDPSYTSACFGWARCLAAQNNIADAAQALSLVPASHSLYTQSRIGLAQILMKNELGLNEQLIEQVSNTIQSISVEGDMVHQLAAKLLSCALNLISLGKLKENHQMNLLGHPLNVTALRTAAEKEYRQVARYAATAEKKIFWVDMANAVRPRTWL